MTSTIFTYTDNTTSTSNSAILTNTSYDTTKTLKSVKIGTSCYSLAEECFYPCSSLSSVTFDSPSSLTTIGDDCFLYTIISSVKIPSSVTSLGVGSFGYCPLTTLIFDSPSSLTTIGDDCFLSTNLTSIRIPSSVTSLGVGSFGRCIKLSSVIFSSPSSLTTISDDCFLGDISLTSIEIPASVTNLGVGTFGRCLKLSSVIFSSPSSLTTISDECFSGDISLTSIEIPASVISLGTSCFENCRNLKNIEFDNQNNLTTIGIDTFLKLNNPLIVTYYFTSNYNNLTQASKDLQTQMPKNSVFIYISTASCYNEGTKILCLNTNSQEEYILIENLKKGDLVKTYKHGYKKIDLIGKKKMINNPEIWYDCMYKMKKTEKNNLIEDLIITGGHSILVNNLGDYKEKNDLLFLGETEKIDDKYLLLAEVSNDFVKIVNNDKYTYYHLTLENDEDRKFGIYVNGILSETTTNFFFNYNKFELL